MLRHYVSDLWADQTLRERLSWYYEVLRDLRPAKFLICKLIACKQNPRLMTEAQLCVTSKRFAFVQQRTVEEGRIRKTQRVETIGIKINLPREKMLGAQCEARVRKTGTFSKENFNVLIVSLDTDQGMENPVFRVADPKGWETAIQKAMGGEVIATGTGARTCKYCGKGIGDRDSFCSSCGKSQT